MKRAHRRWHRLAWLLLAPVLVAVLGVAAIVRTVEPASADVPAPLHAAPVAEGG